MAELFYALLLFLQALLYDFGPRCFRYYLKLGIFYFTLTSLSLIVLPLSLLTPKRVENMILPTHLLSRFSRILGIRFNVHGEEILAEDTSFVMVVNHQHSLDVLAMSSLWPRKCSTVAKRSLLFAGPFGPFLWLSGTVFIDRKNKLGARRKLQQSVQDARDAKIKVAVFPEGTRHHNPNTREMLSFKEGAFAAAIEARVPVLPVVISHYGFLDTKHHRLDPASVDIFVLDPIPTDKGDYDGQGGVQKLTELARERMLAKFVSS